MEKRDSEWQVWILEKSGEGAAIRRERHLHGNHLSYWGWLCYCTGEVFIIVVGKIMERQEEP